MLIADIGKELKAHAPFTLFGAFTGILMMAAVIYAGIPRTFSQYAFWVLHPFHVFLSALVTARLYRLRSRGPLWKTLLIGYFGSVGIATLSDSIIPYVGEFLLALPNKEAHLGFIEKWWLVNPLALAGIMVAWFWPRTKVTHAGHVLLSTWASLFHMTMGMGISPNLLTIGLIVLFLFLAVWLPCCTSDIVFPVLFTPSPARRPVPSPVRE